MITDNVVWHEPMVKRADRASRQGHNSAVLWFTGLSGAGKSTIAHAVEYELHSMGCHTYVLDGDNVRHGLCGDLSFSADARSENIRRIAELGKLFVDAGVIALSAFISPFREDRRRAKKLLGDDMLEIHCACSLQECERRDVKGMYKRARRGELADFTGISSPYEIPEHADLIIHTDQDSIQECTRKVLDMLLQRGIINDQHLQASTVKDAPAV